MRLLLGALFALMLSTDAGAGPPPRIKLVCETTEEPRSKLPIKKQPVRLEENIQCKLSATGSYKAWLQVRWLQEENQRKSGPEHKGTVTADQPFDVTLEADVDHIGCIDFVIQGRLLDESGKVVAKKAITQKQTCLD